MAVPVRPGAPYQADIAHGMGHVRDYHFPYTPCAGQNPPHPIGGARQAGGKIPLGADGGGEGIEDRGRLQQKIGPGLAVTKLLILPLFPPVAFKR
jgi:hypothetical protein